jgi:hypothetical protein
MNWSTTEQLIRIVMYTAGGLTLGDGVAAGDQFQGAIGGVVSIVAFSWWFLRERSKPS